ncbi:hypothetical protein OUZ56_031012 [Daphnia magna]|uniref:Uncharacterized protein n=1 Tax=Daphnia magna TaxID=35525 RepID=A0ABQ9ZSZ4_9CRUS|nr:hypothetical protein OUZ56_031012 [Daphnia magna]
MADRKPDTHILQCYLGSHHSLLNRNKSAQVNSTEWRAIGGTCRPLPIPGGFCMPVPLYRSDDDVNIRLISAKCGLTGKKKQ